MFLWLFFLRYHIEHLNNTNTHSSFSIGHIFLFFSHTQTFRHTNTQHTHTQTHNVKTSSNELKTEHWNWAIFNLFFHISFHISFYQPNKISKSLQLALQSLIHFKFIAIYWLKSKHLTHARIEIRYHTKRDPDLYSFNADQSAGGGGGVWWGREHNYVNCFVLFTSNRWDMITVTYNIRWWRFLSLVYVLFIFLSTICCWFFFALKRKFSDFYSAECMCAKDGTRHIYTFWQTEPVVWQTTF